MTTPAQFLIVDDDMTNNFLCKCAIQVLFPESSVQAFTDPQEALTVIFEQFPGGYEKGSIVLFLDINMPHLSGWAFLDEFEKFDARLRRQFAIYMLTSSIDPYDEKKASTESTIFGFLSKPLIVSELRKLFVF